MPDEHSEKIVRLLEEIRDLTILRNDKLETMVQDNRKRAEELARRQEAARITAKKRFYISLAATGILILILAVLVFEGF